MNKECNLTAGLEEVIHLAVGARVMLRRNLDTGAGLVKGAIGTVLAIRSSSPVTGKFDNIEEPYDVTKVKSRFCVLKNFYIHRQQFPAVTIHKSQGLSLDCTFQSEITIRCASHGLFTNIHNGIQNVCEGGQQTQTKVQT